ncbi:hypothetical protein D3C78_1689670 [compost metagenome]
MNVAIMPTKPMMASHQICQIIAKPNTMLKAPMTTPVPVLRGIWMSVYLAGFGQASPRCLRSQKSSSSVTSGKVPKL